MITSVFFSNERIQVVLGEASAKKIKISEYYSAPISEGIILNGVITNDYALKRQLSELFSKYKIPKSRIHVVIDSNSILTKSISVPMTTPENIHKIVAGEFVDVENYDDMLFDYFVLCPRLETGGASVLGCATEKSFIASYTEIFESIKGAKIASIDLALDCQIKLVRFLEATKRRTFIVGMLDKNILTLSLYVSGQFKFTSRTRLFEDRGTQNSPDEISRAISSMIQFSTAQKYNSEITDVYLCGMNDREFSLCSSLSQVLSVQNISAFPACSDTVLNKIKRPVESMLTSECLYCIGNLIRL